MKTVLEYYDIYPKVLCTERPATITLRALGDHVAFKPMLTYRVLLVPMNETLLGMQQPCYQTLPTQHVESGLTFCCHPTVEQQYQVLLQRQEEESWVQCCELRIFALRPDFFALRPYRGDMHCHTCYSDGVESPAIVAANYRKAGFDFLSITDHGQYQPSLEAIAAYQKLNLSFHLFAGEEVHPPQNHCHTVHFGGGYSVNDIFRKEPERYQREIDEIVAAQNVPEGVDAREYASLLWVYREIKKAGGLSIMAHPCWTQDNAYHISRAMYHHLLRTHPFDALELTCGQTLEENQQQLSLWQQMREEGNAVPVVGSSDSHGTVNSEWFGLSKMLVLAPQCTAKALMTAIRERRVAVLEQYKGESLPRVYGENRTVEFALFLITEYLPLHDELCFEEGRLMKAYACGDTKAGELLQQLGCRTDRLQDKYWAQE